jgi:hypothetical protein
MELFEETGEDLNSFMKTIFTDIYIFNFTKNLRDVDRDGRRNILHVSFGINVMHI